MPVLFYWQLTFCFHRPALVNETQTAIQTTSSCTNHSHIKWVNDIIYLMQKYNLSIPSIFTCCCTDRLLKNTATSMPFGKHSNASHWQNQSYTNKNISTASIVLSIKHYNLYKKIFENFKSVGKYTSRCNSNYIWIF